MGQRLRLHVEVVGRVFPKGHICSVLDRPRLVVLNDALGELYLLLVELFLCFARELERSSIRGGHSSPSPPASRMLVVFEGFRSC